MITLRIPALHAAAIAGLVALQPVRVSAQWWHRAPVDFEECAEAAEKAATREEKTTALAECNAKFAGRRKPGGGYTYYDFMQDRSFDIAGPNPTAEEQKHIDEQYTLYLENQRRSSVAAAFAAKQQQPPPQQPEATSLKTDTSKVPLPQQRPKHLATTGDVRASKGDCARRAFSCEWPRLSGTINDLKKLFVAQPGRSKRADAAGPPR